jgi:uncharacterized membrane protein
MGSRKNDDDLDDTERPVFMTAIFILGVIATIFLMLFAMYQFMDSALSRLHGSPFDMMCGLFSAMGMIAFIWIVIFIAMWFTGSSSRKKRRPPKFFDWQI